jgi:conjugative transfer region lipoprotein (TIGR03751 family)
LTGCANPGKGTLPAGGDMTMADIYKQETGIPSEDKTNNDDPHFSLEETRHRMEVLSETTNYRGYTTTSLNQLHHLFKKLNNPEVPLYIYPHLILQNEEDIPVPGYTTAFFLYQRNQFVLPNERF